MSYLIVDEADMEIEMAEDPFLEAGIDIPPANLPYKDEGQKEESSKILMPEGQGRKASSNTQSRANSLRSRGRQKRLDSTVSTRTALEAIIEFTTNAGLPKGSRVKSRVCVFQP